MDIKIIGEHIEITEAISGYIKSKFSHLPLPDKLNHVEFRIGKHGKVQHHIKFNAHFNQKDITIDVIEEDTYVGIDHLMKKIHNVLTKHKNKDNIHLIKK